MNAGQEDFDNDGEGDDCDCDDGYWGPNEDGADCGGSCAAACPAGCVPVIQYGDSSGKIDIVFIPSEEYAGIGGPFLGITADQLIGGVYTPVPLPLHWRTDTLYLIQNSYYQDAKIAAALAKLDPADREAARAQGFCPVLGGTRLGAMGKPFKLTFEGGTVFLCCSSGHTPGRSRVDWWVWRTWRSNLKHSRPPGSCLP